MTELHDQRAHAGRSLEIFAVLWAFASLFHQGKSGVWVHDGLDVLMTLAAVAVLVRPSSLANFMVLAVVQFAALFVKLPNLTNHSMVFLVADLTIMAAIVREAWLRPGAPIDKEVLYDAIAPALRIEMLILYFFVVFHKLNWDFLDPRYSAAVEHYKNLSRTLGKLGLPQLSSSTWAKYAAIHGTLVVETAIPLLVVWRPTRIAGLWLGLVFHFALSIEDFYDFTSMMYALLFLFAPANFPALLAQWWDGSSLRRAVVCVADAPILRTIPIRVWIAVAGVVVVGTLNILDRQTSFRVFKVLWFFYGAAVVVAFAGALHGRRREEALAYKPGMLRLAPLAFAVFPLVVFLNGACPYLGLKTRSCFAMFSNLRTEGGTTNHVFVPAWIQVAGFQKHMIHIVESSDPALADLARSGNATPFFNLRSVTSARAARGDTGIYVKYVENGKTITVANAERDRELSKPYPYPLRKFLLFGETNPGPHQVNRH